MTKGGWRLLNWKGGYPGHADDHKEAMVELDLDIEDHDPPTDATRLDGYLGYPTHTEYHRALIMRIRELKGALKAQEEGQ